MGGPLTHDEVRVARLVVGNLALQLQTLTQALEIDGEIRDQARTTLKAAEMAELSIERLKTPLRRLIRGAK